MNNLIKKSQQLFSNKLMGFFFMAVIMFWIKTYIGYRVEFSLGIENGIQTILIICKSIKFGCFVFCFSFFSKREENI